MKGYNFVSADASLFHCFLWIEVAVFCQNYRRYD